MNRLDSQPGFETGIEAVRTMRMNDEVPGFHDAMRNFGNLLELIRNDYREVRPADLVEDPRLTAARRLGYDRTDLEVQLWAIFDSMREESLRRPDLPDFPHLTRRDLHTYLIDPDTTPLEALCNLLGVLPTDTREVLAPTFEAFVYGCYTSGFCEHYPDKSESLKIFLERIQDTDPETGHAEDPLEAIAPGFSDGIDANGAPVIHSINLDRPPVRYSSDQTIQEYAQLFPETRDQVRALIASTNIVDPFSGIAAIPYWAEAGARTRLRVTEAYNNLAELEAAKHWFSEQLVGRGFAQWHVDQLLDTEPMDVLLNRVRKAYNMPLENYRDIQMPGARVSALVNQHANVGPGAQNLAPQGAVNYAPGTPIHRQQIDALPYHRDLAHANQQLGKLKSYTVDQLNLHNNNDPSTHLENRTPRQVLNEIDSVYLAGSLGMGFGAALDANPNVRHPITLLGNTLMNNAPALLAADVNRTIGQIIILLESHLPKLVCQQTP